MSIEQKIEGSVGKLFLSDEIDLDKSPQVRENIKDLIDKATTIEVQMSRVKYIDSSGIAALIEGMQLAKSNSKEFYLTDVSNEVMKVIELAHLDKFFKIKNATGQNASDDTAEPAPEPEPEVQATENVDLNVSEEGSAPQGENENNQTDEIKPSVKRDEDGGDDDKIKFKR